VVNDGKLESKKTSTILPRTELTEPGFVLPHFETWSVIVHSFIRAIYGRISLEQS
jgi:hypothetical protein